MKCKQVQTWVIVRSDGTFLAGYCAHLTTKYDGDDSYEIRPRWELDWQKAKVFETKWGALKAAKRIGLWQAAAVG